MALKAGRAGVSPLEVTKRGKLKINADIASVKGNIEKIGDVISSDKWNQLIAPFMYPTSTASGISRTVTGNAITLAGTASADAYISIVDLTGITKGHKFFIKLNELGSGAVPEIYIGNSSTVGTTGIELTEESIVEIPADYADTITGIYMKAVNTKVYNSTFMPIMTDVTELYGSGNEPETVAKFREIFSHDYYEFKQVGIGDLLWINANPSSEFAGGQTISLDLTKYKFINIILQRVSSIAGIGRSELIKIGMNSFISISRATDATYKFEIVSRGVNTTTSSVYFGNANISNYVETSQDNDYMIPLEIYGIR